MNELDEVAGVVWSMVSMMVRSNSAPEQETGCQDKDGVAIKTGDVLELWMGPEQKCFAAEPSEEEKAVREVLVVHARDGKFYGVDYDILQGLELHELASYATLRGNVFTEEGLEYLRMGLMRFNGEADEGEEP